MNRHRDLIAWQVCRRLASHIYHITKSFPAHERFGLTAQLRRAAVSAMANIAEGNARRGSREFSHALSMTLGSLAEVDALLAVAEDENHVTKSGLDDAMAIRDEASRVTFGLQRNINKRA